MSSEYAQLLKEIEAFYNFFATFQLSRPVTSVANLTDGAVFFDILSLVYILWFSGFFIFLEYSFFFASDTSYFRHPTRPGSSASGSARPIENWVLRFSALKRLYRLMTQYVSDVLQKPTSSLDVPDLQAIAKDFDLGATLVMCRLLIVIGVQCERNKEFIDKIRCLGEGDQHLIMKAIEQVSLEILVCRRM